VWSEIDSAPCNAEKSGKLVTDYIANREYLDLVRICHFTVFSADSGQGRKMMMWDLLLNLIRKTRASKV
jgi:hypothetical protein